MGERLTLEPDAGGSGAGSALPLSLAAR